MEMGGGRVTGRGKWAAVLGAWLSIILVGQPQAAACAGGVAPHGTRRRCVGPDVFPGTEPLLVPLRARLVVGTGVGGSGHGQATAESPR